jgi:hypothetical protein
LREIGAADPALAGLGTTLTAMLWSGTRAAVCHIGDSRAYLLRFWADRCRREGDIMVFEGQHPGGGWKITWEIHAANMEEVIDGDVPPP